MDDGPICAATKTAGWPAYTVWEVEQRKYLLGAEKPADIRLPDASE